MNWLPTFGLIVISLAAIGCGGNSDPKPSGPIDAETQAEIDAQDQAVEEEESALD